MKVCCKFPWCVVGEVAMGGLGGVVHVYLIYQKLRPRRVIAWVGRIACLGTIAVGFVVSTFFDQC